MSCYVADIATFDILFPEFVDIDDATVQFYLDHSDCELSFKYWGDTKPQAQLYYSAHQIALSQNRQASSQTTPDGEVVTIAGAGAVTSASAAQLSVGFQSSATGAQGNNADAYFTTTQYGQMFLALKHTYMPIGLLASCQ